MITASKRNHKRSQSWPPLTIKRSRSWPSLKVQGLSRQSKQNIDEDPFLFFISEPENIDSSWNENLSAGIEGISRARPLSPCFTRLQKQPKTAGSSDKAPQARPLSPFRPHSPFFNRRQKDSEFVNPPAAPKTTKLKIWIQKMETRYRPKKRPVDITVPKNSPATPRPDSPASPQIRGRGNIRGSPRALASRSRGTRSHSERPRAWREPGEDIWTLSEEQEDLGLGIFAEAADY